MAFLGVVDPPTNFPSSYYGLEKLDVISGSKFAVPKLGAMAPTCRLKALLLLKGRYYNGTLSLELWRSCERPFDPGRVSANLGIINVLLLKADDGLLVRVRLVSAVPHSCIDNTRTSHDPSSTNMGSSQVRLTLIK